MGRQEEGKKNIELSKEKHYNDPPYIQLAAAYLSQKNYKDALGIYQTLIGLYPKNVSYHAVLALLYKETGQFDRARLEAIEVFKLNPENPETIEFIKSLMEFKPGDITLHYVLVDIYKTLGNQEKLKEEFLVIASIYKQLIASNPLQNSHHRLSLAYVYKELGDYQKAVDEALIALKLAPGGIKEVEEFFKLMPPEYLKKYEDYLRSNPALFYKVYGNLPGSLKK